MSSDKGTMIKLLEYVEPQIESEIDELNLCYLAESLGRIKLVAGTRDASNRAPESDVSKVNQTLSSSDDDVSIGNENTTALANSTSSRQSMRESTGELYDLLQITERMLSKVATKATTQVGSYKTDSLRRFLMVYALLPFQADNLVRAIDEEIGRRQSQLSFVESTESVEKLLAQAANSALSINSTVFGKPGDSPLAALMAGLRMLFSTSTSPREETQLSDEVSNLLSEAIESISALQNRVEQISSASNLRPETKLQNIAVGTSFELGRCRELIDHYRLIEFSTRRRQSRFDQKGRQRIAKRVLGRVLPTDM